MTVWVDDVLVLEQTPTVGDILLLAQAPRISASVEPVPASVVLNGFAPIIGAKGPRAFTVTIAGVLHVDGTIEGSFEGQLS